MMLWGKMTDQYNENSLGYATGTADLSRSYWLNRSFWNDPFLSDKPNLVVYAESHDEERTMYKNVTFGNSSGGYNVKTLATALQRGEAMAAMLLMTPGPKMIWQFGETGYDYSINTCSNGTQNSNCRTDAKPIKWDYFQDAARKKLYAVYAALNKLRGLYPNPFNSNSISTGTNLGSSLNKVIVLNHTDLKVVVLTNFNVTAQTIKITFPVAGSWYSYLTGDVFTATGGSQSINLQPGEYYVYLDRVVAGGIVTSTRDIILSNNDFRVSIYPNPVQQNSTVEYELPESGKVTIAVTNIMGQMVGIVNRGFQVKGLQQFSLNSNKFASSRLTTGNYLLQVKVNNKVRIEKFVVQR